MAVLWNGLKWGRWCANLELDDHVASRTGKLLEAEAPDARGHGASFLTNGAANARPPLDAGAVRTCRRGGNPERHGDARQLRETANLRSRRGADAVEPDGASRLAQAKR
jgi:hypothetical protein